MKSFKGKVFVVTGGASGIGHSLCKELSSKGAVIFSIDKNLPEERVQGVKYLTADVTASPQIKKSLSRIKKIDCLVNNAGIIRRGTMFDVSEEEFDLLFRVNVKGYWLVIKHALPNLAEHATIVVISSRHAMSLPEDPAVYAITKQADIALAKILSDSYPSLDVRVVCPGTVDTALARYEVPKKELAKKEMQSPDDLAKKIVAFISSAKKNMLYDDLSKKYCFE